MTQRLYVGALVRVKDLTYIQEIMSIGGATVEVRLADRGEEDGFPFCVKITSVSLLEDEYDDNISDQL